MSFHIGLKRGYDESILLDSFKSYYELDKAISNFESETEFLNSIDRKDFNEVLISNQDRNFNSISSTARALIPIVENGNIDDYINAIISSIFYGKTKSIDIEKFKLFLMEEKLKFSKVNNSFGESKLLILDKMLYILNNLEFNNNVISMFRSQLVELLDDKSYYKVRNLYTTLNDFGFVYDETINGVFEENKFEINEIEKESIINNYNRKIESYFYKKNQMSFQDFTEKVFSEIRDRQKDEVSGDMSFPPSKKLNLRG